MSKFILILAMCLSMKSMAAEPQRKTAADGDKWMKGFIKEIDVMAQSGQQGMEYNLGYKIENGKNREIYGAVCKEEQQAAVTEVLKLARISHEPVSVIIQNPKEEKLDSYSMIKGCIQWAKF